MKTDTDVNSKQFLDGIAQIRNTSRTDGISPYEDFNMSICNRLRWVVGGVFAAPKAFGACLGMEIFSGTISLKIRSTGW